MDKQVADALAALRDLGTPDEIRALAERRLRPESPRPVNAHIHLPPNFSAFDSVEQAVSLAGQQGIGVLGVSNYYDFDVYGEFAQRAGARGIFPLFGLEIICMQDELRDAGVKVNDPGNPGKTYVCGKGITRFDEMTPEAARLLDVIRRNDSRRMEVMINRLRDIFGKRGLEVDVDAKSVVDMVVRRHGVPRETVYLQERHLSQAFQEALFQRTRPEDRLDCLRKLLGAPTKARDPEDYVAIQDDIRSHLMKAGKPAFVEEAFVSFAEARRLILELGGIPCYPALADGASPICEYETDPDDLVRRIKDCNLHAVEWIPIRNKTDVLCQYVTKMRSAGLAVTAGTEHNTLDLIRFNPFCKDGDVPGDIRQIFWEGACVVAAHQFLTAHGQCGYVDSAGVPNGDYDSADSRIEAFASIGAAVIERYHETCSAG